MFNMLIAIMGDTFGRVIENRTVNAIKSKLELVGQLASTLKTRDTEQEDMIFIHIIQPIDGMDDEEGDEWEGMVKRMTSVSTKNIKTLGKVLGKKVDELQKSVDDFKTLDSQQDSGLKMQVERKFSAVEAKIDERFSTMEAKMDANQ